jgi:glycosyl transferase, family 25
MQSRQMAFVVHYTPLRERKEHMLRELAREGVDAVFIESFDREALTPDGLSKFRIVPAEASLLLKHVEAWRRVVDQNLPYALVFEDDAILVEGFQSKLKAYLEETPSDFDLLMINEGCNLHISNIVEGKHIYLRGTTATSWGGDGGTRCLDGYVISNKCARSFIDLFQSSRSISKPIDWWTNDLLRFIDATVYWAEPSLVSQGTETGLFKSSIRHPS